MVVSGGPSIVDEGLVLHLDAGDTNSYNDYNIVTHSENFTSSFGWVNSVNWGSFGIVANDAIAPNGTQTADRLNFSGASKAKVSNKFAVSEGEVYTISAWVKVPTDSNRVLEQYTNVEFQTYDTSNNLASMAVGGTNYGGDYYKTDRWVRFITTYTVPAGIGYMRGIIHGAQNPLADFSFYVWGVQIVIGSQPLRYHPTANGKGYGINLVDNSYLASLENGVGFSKNNKGYFSFDSTNENIVLNKTFGNLGISNAHKNFTISVWFMDESDGSTNQQLIGNFAGYNSLMGLMISSNYRINGVIRGSCGGGCTTSVYSSENVYLPNTWNQAVMTWTSSFSGNSDAQTLKIYCNGQFLNAEQSSNANKYDTFEYPINPIPIRIGRSHVSYNYTPLSGKIAMASIYNKVLTLEEIQQNYHATKGRFL
jgi:hypothetical protein